MSSSAIRRAVVWVLVLNLGYFFIEMAVALAIGSVALFADSIDFLEDASVNFLVLVTLGWSATGRRRVGLLLAALLLVPSAAALWTAWVKFNDPIAPAAFALTITGFGALLVNTVSAFLLVKVKDAGGSLTRAAFLSARNDVLANIGIIAAGLLTAVTLSAWPDLMVGLAIAALNAGAAHEVYEAALGEQDEDAARA